MLLGLSLPGTGGVINLGPKVSADIHTCPMNAWDQLGDALTAAQIDAAFINLPLAMDLFNAGADISLLMFVNRGGSQMICHPDISRILDFKGKSVLIPHPLTVQHMLVHKLVSTKGLTLSQDSFAPSVFAEPVPPCLMPEMMADDIDADIAACIAPAPFVTEAVSRGWGKRFLSTQDLWKNHPCCGFVVKNDVLHSYSEEIQALIGLFFESAVILDHHLSGSHELDDHTLLPAAEFLGRTASITREALTSSGVMFAPQDLIPTPGSLDIIQAYMSDTMGLLDPATDLNTFINPAFARNALTELSP